MPRVKGGYTTRRRRKAVLKLAKGYYGSKHLLYKTANEQVMRSLQYAYRDRKVKKREFRKLWIQRINAAAKLNGLKYSEFICGLSRQNIEVNRKMLADLAVNDPKAFTTFCDEARKGLQKDSNKVKENVVVLTKESKAVRAEKVAKELTSIKKEAKKAPAKAEAKVEVKKAPAKAEVKASNGLETKTVEELKTLCKEAGIKGISKMNKADLIAALTK
jgi:large subunit ribosomal protein L20